MIRLIRERRKTAGKFAAKRKTVIAKYFHGLWPTQAVGLDLSQMSKRASDGVGPIVVPYRNPKKQFKPKHHLGGKFWTGCCSSFLRNPGYAL
jgi:hypothetical protein